MIYVLIIAVSALGISIVIPHFQRLAHSLDFVDKPTSRKIHSNPVPLCGGIAMFFIFITMFLMLFELNSKNIVIASATLMILLIGLVDDWYKSRGKDYPALPKFLIQVFAASLVFFYGVRIQMISNPFNDSYIIFPFYIQYVITVVWIFGVTTVMNFIDGLDGLTSGISAISATTLLIVSITKELHASAMLAAIIVGISLGFLKYNKHPASTFMGDSGATFLGFVIAILSIEGPFKSATLISLAIPVIVLGVPIFDNIFVVYKRISENKPPHIADRSQLHYRLLNSGMNHKQTVMVLYLVTACLSLFSIILMMLEK